MTELRNNKMFRYLLVLTISSTVGLHIWRTLLDNFGVNVLDLNGGHIGILQSVRELPGFLALLVIYVLLIVKEHRLSAFSVLLLGVGVAITGLIPSFSALIFATLIMSFGFHYFETTNQSLVLQYFDIFTAPVVFGRLRSLAAVGNICAGGAVFILAPVLSYAGLYLFFGCLVIIAALWALGQDPSQKNTVTQKNRLVLKKKYWLYYVLTFIAGARRQIFIAFAVFLLVKKFHFSIQEIAVLFLFNNIINYFLPPLIGKAIVKYGERRVLSVEYFGLIIVFIAYGLVEMKIAAAFLYIIDHILFNFAIAIRTFYQKISDPEDIAPSMAVGFTINHIAAILLPVIGGFLWLVDYRIVFFSGALFSFISLLFVQLITGQLKRFQTDTDRSFPLY